MNDGATILALAARLAAALFAGAALYINLVEHPARTAAGPAAALAQWRPSYARATWLQAPLAVVGFSCGLEAWLSGAGAAWLAGALALGLVVPFTLLVVMPTNRRLQSAELDPGSPEAGRLLARWNRLHGVRSALGLAALVLFLLAD